MKLKLQRDSNDSRSTLGRLFVDGRFECYTCEDEPRSTKVRGETRIPAGRYNVALRMEGGFHNRYLTRFGRSFHKGMLWVQDVPGFEWILIHIGNTEADTDGCILVGKRKLPNGEGGGMVASSKDAYVALYPKVRDALLNGERVELEVCDELAD